MESLLQIVNSHIRVVNAKSLFSKVIKKWYLLLVFMLLFVLLSIPRGTNPAASQDDIDKKTAYETEISFYEAEAASFIDYIENSVVFSVDPFNVNKGTCLIQAETMNNAAQVMNTIQNGIDYSSYRNDKNPVYITEQIKAEMINDTSVLLTVTGFDHDDAQALLDFICNEITRANQENDVNVTISKKQVSAVFDQELAEKANKIANLYTQNQKDVADLRNKSNSINVEESAKTINKKKIILFAVMGCGVGALLLALYYVLNNRVLSAEDACGQYLLDNFTVLNKGKNKDINYEKTKALLNKKADKHNELFIVSELPQLNLDELARNLSDSALTVKPVEYDSDGNAILPSNSVVLLAVKANESKYSNINELIRTIDIYNNKIIGLLVL
ncbi:MAG: hypothetical protein E7185_01240 [Erysipelotrichaceae bacterium]|nr:hypothetical protein [Erysipelotrichaceae bacterium]